MECIPRNQFELSCHVTFQHAFFHTIHNCLSHRKDTCKVTNDSSLHYRKSFLWQCSWGLRDHDAAILSELWCLSWLLKGALMEEKASNLYLPKEFFNSSIASVLREAVGIGLYNLILLSHKFIETFRQPISPPPSTSLRTIETYTSFQKFPLADYSIQLF